MFLQLKNQFVFFWVKTGAAQRKPMWRITRSFTVNGSGKQEQLKRKKANGTVQQRPLWSHLRLSVE